MKRSPTLAPFAVMIAVWLWNAGLVDAAEFSVQRAEDQVTIMRDGRPVGEYVFRDAKISRPHWTRLHAPGGAQVSRRHPPVPGEDAVDHDTMHPGLWLAFGDLNGVDFWRNKGRIEHVRFVDDPVVGADGVSFAAEDRYVAPTGEEVCRGVSEFRVIAGEALEPAVPGTVILMQFSLRSEREQLTFGPQHEMGLGIRVATPLVVKNGSGSITASHGGKNEAGTWGRVGTWWDYGGTIDGTRAGILVAAAADNPRAVWAHARDYGFLALNPTGPPRRPADGEPAEPFTVAKGDALRLKFAVLLHAQPAADAWSPDAASRAVAAALDAWKPREPGSNASSR
ncbi:MAG: PmoA family protein [Planctomycetes bacterium]|nr:PmoA family protein [Planctomycetota bacterium]